MSVSSSLAPSGRRDIHHEQVAWVMKNQDDGKKMQGSQIQSVGTERKDLPSGG